MSQIFSRPEDSLKYLRSYTGADGETHLEELEANLTPKNFIPGMPPLDLSAQTAATAVVFARLLAGWYGDYHPSPRRQFALTLSGEAEITMSDGQKRLITPGAIWLIEDTSGRGHRTRVSEKSDWVIALVWLAE